MNGGKPMNDNNSMTATAERLSDTEWLEDKWNRTDWKAVQNSVKRLQTGIAKATKAITGNMAFVHTDCKPLLSQVTARKGDKIPELYDSETVTYSS